MTRSKSLLPLILLTIVGCKGPEASAPKVDLSSPAATLHTYLAAIRSGDAATAAKATIDDPKSQRTTLLQLNWISGYERLKSALKAKNLPTPHELGIDDFMVAEGVAEQIDIALESPVRMVMSGDKKDATVAASAGYTAPHTVRYAGGQWKVDHTEFQEPGVLRERAAAYPVLAQAILDGEVTTAEQAKAFYTAAAISAP